MYKCEKCEHTKEALQKFNDSPLVTCPECGEDTLKKQIASGTGVLFKGHGWMRPGLSAGNSGSK